MAVDNNEIERRVLDYIQDAISRHDVPTRQSAIREITGKVEVLPSAVARAITGLIEAGKLRQVRDNGDLELVE